MTRDGEERRSLLRRALSAWHRRGEDDGAPHYTTAPGDRVPFPQRVIYGAGAFVNNMLAAAIGGMIIVLNLGLAGFILLGLELVWFRFLLHFLFGSSHGFQGSEHVLLFEDAGAFPSPRNVDFPLSENSCYCVDGFGSA